MVAVRVSNLPPDSNHGLWMRESRCRREPAARDGKVIPGLSVVVSEHRGDLAASTLHFEVAAGPWQVVETWDGHNRGSRSAQQRQRGPTALWRRALATSQGTTLTVTHNIKNAAVRLIAVDLEGQEHPSSDRGESKLNGFSQLEADFDLSPEEFPEYRLQKRSFEQVEIPNIALEPTGAEAPLSGRDARTLQQASGSKDGP